MKSGNAFEAISCGNDKIIATTNLAQIKNAGLNNPYDVDSSTKKERSRQPELARAYDFRAQVQRRFDTGRVKRAKDYAAYIKLCASGNILGDTPPINIWVPNKGEFENGVFYVPYNLPLIAIDGETQTLARFLVADELTETWEGIKFPVIFHNGIELEAAEQRLHDYNRYAHPVDEKKLASANKAGPLTIAAEAAISAAGWSMADIRTDGALPRKNRKEVASFNQIQSGIIGATVGEVSLSSSVGSQLKALNHPGSTVNTNGAGSAFIQAIAKTENPGHLPEALWLILGVVSVTKGLHNVNSEVIAKLQATWDSTKPKGRGGPRMKVKDRLETVYRSV